MLRTSTDLGVDLIFDPPLSSPAVTRTVEKQTVSVAFRVTVDCTECANPIPVNGLVPQVLCTTCQAVVPMKGNYDWSTVFTYQIGEGCLEHGILTSTSPRSLFHYFLAFGPGGGSLYRKRRGLLVEVDAAPPKCIECRMDLAPSALVAEVRAEGRDADAFCPGCGASIPLRPPTKRERHVTHATCMAVVGETAPRGDLSVPPVDDVRPVLFSCMGCGAPLSVDASTSRVLTCEYCAASNYLPDALWLRLHPAARKRPFFLLLEPSPRDYATAKKYV